jgi:hypothetical protein
MMPTLWSLFFESEALPVTGLRKIEESPELDALRHVLRGEVDPSFWVSASNAIGDGLHSMLNASLLDVLLRSWYHHPDVRRRLEGVPPSSTIVLLDLGEHEIVSRHKPRIQIQSGSRMLGALEFDLQLTLMVQLARLQLEDGRIMRGTLGACSGCGWLKLGSEEIASFRMQELALPSQVSFGAGLRLEDQSEVRDRS